MSSLSLHLCERDEGILFCLQLEAKLWQSQYSQGERRALVRRGLVKSLDLKMCSHRPQGQSTEAFLKCLRPETSTSLIELSVGLRYLELTSHPLGLSTPCVNYISASFRSESKPEKPYRCLLLETAASRVPLSAVCDATLLSHGDFRKGEE